MFKMPHYYFAVGLLKQCHSHCCYRPVLKYILFFLIEWPPVLLCFTEMVSFVNYRDKNIPLFFSYKKHKKPEYSLNYLSWLKKINSEVDTT